MKNREDLIEQYDDAVFALLMDEYAEESGAELLTRFQADLDAGLVPEISEAQDSRCIDLIEDEFRSRRWKAWLRSFCRGLIRVVFALFYLAGLLVRTAWELWQEHRSHHVHVEPNRAESPEDEPTIFLTP